MVYYLIVVDQQRNGGRPFALAKWVSCRNGSRSVGWRARSCRARARAVDNAQSMCTRMANITRRLAARRLIIWSIYRFRERCVLSPELLKRNCITKFVHSSCIHNANVRAGKLLIYLFDQSIPLYLIHSTINMCSTHTSHSICSAN